MGMFIIRVIARREGAQTIEELRELGFGVTSFQAEGQDGPADVFYTVIKRAELHRVVSVINELNERAFYTIEALRFVSEHVQTPSVFLTRDTWV